MSAPALLSLAALVGLLALTMDPPGRYMATAYGSRPDGSAPGETTVDVLASTGRRRPVGRSRVAGLDGSE